MGVIIKGASYDDIPAIHDIIMEAFGKYAKELGLPDQVEALKETYDSIKEDIDKKIVLVAWLEEKPVGTIRCEVLPSGDTWYISRFGVKTNNHNNGVGKALLLAMEEEARKKSIGKLTLHTATKMSSLVGLYYRMGFYIQSITTDKGYIRGYFCKDLNNSGRE